MFDTYIKIDGIDGESQDSKHKDWIEVESVSHRINQPKSASISSLGGGTTGRVEFDDYQIVKGVDKASPKLAEACCKGTHIPKVTVEYCRSGGDKLVYLKVDMTDVVITEVIHSANSKGTSDFPSETVGLNAGKVTWTYTQQDRATGQSKGQVQTSWNLVSGATS